MFVLGVVLAQWAPYLIIAYQTWCACTPSVEFVLGSRKTLSNHLAYPFGWFCFGSAGLVCTDLVKPFLYFQYSSGPFSFCIGRGGVPRSFMKDRGDGEKQFFLGGEGVGERWGDGREEGGDGSDGR